MSELHSQGTAVLPRWLLWSIVALVSWGVWAILAKVLGDALSAAQSQALSTLGILPVILALALRKGSTTSGNRVRGALCAFAGGALGCVGNMAYYDALSRGARATTVVPLTALYPLVTIVLAVLILREKLNHIQRAGVLLSLVAIYLFNVQREEGLLSVSLAYALIPIACWGVAGFLQKLSTNHISGELSTLWFLAAFVPVAVFILARESLPTAITSQTWLAAVALGLFFALGNYAILAAFASHGKASIITPLTALYPIVSVPIAILFFGERIGWRESAGILLALGSVAALSYEEAVPNAR
jgi:drug/metabolite transporter (DMT)-like permease